MLLNELQRHALHTVAHSPIFPVCARRLSGDLSAVGILRHVFLSLTLSLLKVFCGANANGAGRSLALLGFAPL